MKIKSICFLNHPYHRGGVTQWMIDVFKTWNQLNGEAFFVTIRPSTPFISAGNRPTIMSLLNGKYDRNIFFENQGYSFELGSLSYKAYKYLRIIKKNIPEGTPIIPSDDEACWKAAALCSKSYPMVGVLHSDEEIYYKLAEKYYHQASCFICVSTRIEMKLLDRLPQLKGKTITLPCGIEVQKFKPIKDKINQITWVGRLSEYQKRASDVVKIARKIARSNVKAKIVILGDGDYFEKFTKEISENKLETIVELRGWVDSEVVKTELAKSKIFLQTSDFEGTSIAMMEALSSGCNIVSTRVSGVEDLEFLEDAKGVVHLYEIGDIEKASQLVIRLLSTATINPDQAILLANNFFNIRTNANKLKDFIQLALNHKIENRKYDFSITYLFSVMSSPILALLRLIKWHLIK